jgi:SHS2 domain-containing protein
MSTYYEELHHTADWAIRVWGADLTALFVHAAEAMFELQGANLSAEPAMSDEVTCLGMDLETLLVAWLNELLFASEINDALYTRFDVHITPNSGRSLAEPASEYALFASIAGLSGRGPLAHVKAVTYYGLAVTQTGRGWEATVTFDT